MQVKFRGKRKGGNEWLIGDLSHVNGGTYIIPIENAPLNSPDWFEVEPSSIGMFTGLTDKNRKEIFGAVGENGGDIVRALSEGGFDHGIHKNKHFEVLWFSENGSWYIKRRYREDEQMGHLKEMWEMLANCDVEIIGNAFDNPELLEK